MSNVAFWSVFQNPVTINMHTYELTYSTNHAEIKWYTHVESLRQANRICKSLCVLCVHGINSVLKIPVFVTFCKNSAHHYEWCNNLEDLVASLVIVVDSLIGFGKCY